MLSNFQYFFTLAEIVCAVQPLVDSRLSLRCTLGRYSVRRLRWTRRFESCLLVLVSHHARICPRCLASPRKRRARFHPRPSCPAILSAQTLSENMVSKTKINEERQIADLFMYTQDRHIRARSLRDLVNALLQKHFRSYFLEQDSIGTFFKLHCVPNSSEHFSDGLRVHVVYVAPVADTVSDDSARRGLCFLVSHHASACRRSVRLKLEVTSVGVRMHRMHRMYRAATGIDVEREFLSQDST